MKRGALLRVTGRAEQCSALGFGVSVRELKLGESVSYASMPQRLLQVWCKELRLEQERVVALV